MMSYLTIVTLSSIHAHSSNYAGTATVAECLLLLAKGTEWRPAISKRLGGCLDNLPQSQDLSGMFGLLVTAGFPRVRETIELVINCHTRALCCINLHIYTVQLYSTVISMIEQI